VETATVAVVEGSDQAAILFFVLRFLPIIIRHNGCRRNLPNLRRQGYARLAREEFQKCFGGDRRSSKCHNWIAFEHFEGVVPAVVPLPLKAARFVRDRARGSPNNNEGSGKRHPLEFKFKLKFPFKFQFKFPFQRRRLLWKVLGQSTRNHQQGFCR